MTKTAVLGLVFSPALLTHSNPERATVLVAFYCKSHNLVVMETKTEGQPTLIVLEG